MTDPGRSLVGLARVRRVVALAFWRLFNPPARLLAGVAPFWVVLETRGRRTGRPRQTPLARGPMVDGAMYLIAVHGRHSSWVRNLEALPEVRLRVRGRWHDGRAEVAPWDREIVRLFNGYARSGPRVVGIDPVLVRIALGRDAGEGSS